MNESTATPIPDATVAPETAQTPPPSLGEIPVLPMEIKLDDDIVTDSDDAARVWFRNPLNRNQVFSTAIIVRTTGTGAPIQSETHIRMLATIRRAVQDWYASEQGATCLGYVSPGRLEAVQANKDANTAKETT